MTASGSTRDPLQDAIRDLRLVEEWRTKQIRKSFDQQGRIAALEAALRKMLIATETTLEDDDRHDWLDAVCDAREALGEEA